MRDTTQDDLTALVGSRICHDLISPIGAIGNGLELLQLSGLPETPELALIAESVENANARIRFFRIAYGAATPGQMVKTSEVQMAVSASYRGSHICVDWCPDDMSRSDARMAFLVIQCLEAALPYGGRIRISGAPEHLTFEATADRLAAEPALWASLSGTGPICGLRPGQVQFGLLSDHLITERRCLNVALEDTAIRVSFG